ncbi:MAG: MFS transporter [Verrucomicrobia bacterium]|nr:MFS transporter [Verrucomicrobiota bacterium]
MVTRLSLMMFAQFFVWGAWFVTLGQCLGENGLADFIGGAYGSAPIAAIITPLFLGIIVDRLFPSEKMMGILLLLGGSAMCLAPGLASKGSGDAMIWVFVIHMLCYMPTLGLANTIAFTHIKDQSHFPKIRVWGTVGWIVAGLFNGFMGWSASLNIFWVAGLSSIALGLYSFSLPHTPPPEKGKKMDLRALLMVDGLKLLTRPAFLVFFVCSTAICIPLAYYYGLTSMYLGNMGFEQPASSMTLGQMSEIVFMLLIPFFFRKFGVKMMILAGMLGWVMRYALFAFGAPDQVVWMMFLGILLHGICYDFFFVTGFMYADTVSGPSVRGQAQSMLVFVTQGVGMFFGYKLAFGTMGLSKVTHYGELSGAINALTPTQELGFGQMLGKMFAVKMPAVEPGLLLNASAQWKDVWMFPCVMAVVIMVVFAVAFWPKVDSKIEPST